ncbi:M20 family peptidase [Halobacillus salinarum]|uniref:M20 family peptidase n=1 Tax=Halobacillus salinarum TaxID=2932257 RepID=A0ABY4EKD1_9BACI|nr:M20 family peptidase [Halobacillus salinarum]UOQ44935.1 M20 family peptidase [Halobacillus salinarum]
MKIWKLILTLIAALLLIFIIVTAYNTVNVKSKQPPAHPSAVELNQTEAVQHLSKAITFKTISYEDKTKVDPQPYDQFLTFLQDSFPNVFKQLEFEKINTYGLVFKWKGTDEKKLPVGFTSHYDVVPVLKGTEQDWKQKPFSGAVVDGRIWGRGSLDDKIGVIGLLQAADHLLKQGYKPDRDLYFMFGHDEEVGGEQGAETIAETLKKRGVTFDFVLDEGGAVVEDMVPGVEAPVGVVGISEKGSATVQLSIKGSGGHSSQPEDHTNIGRISNAIAKLEAEQFHGDLKGPGEDLFTYVAPEMSFGMKYVFANKFIFEPVIERILLQEPASAALIRTTIAPTIFNAGEQYNALPEKASATINLRLMPGDSLEEVKAFIEKTIDDEDIHVSITGNEASSVSSIDGKPFETIQQAARNVYSDAVIAPYLMFAGSDARHYDKVSNNTYRFLPVRITAEDLNRMHGTNEFVTIDNYMNAIKFYIEVIKQASG